MFCLNESLTAELVFWVVVTTDIKLNELFSLKFVLCEQCDQVWRNFKSIWAIFKSFIHFLAKF